MLWNLVASHRKLMSYDPCLSLRVAWHIGVWLMYIWIIITVMNAKQRKATHGQIQGNYEWSELGWQPYSCITSDVGVWKFYVLNFGWIGCTSLRIMYFEIPTLIFLKNVVHDKIQITLSICNCVSKHKGWGCYGLIMILPLCGYLWDVTYFTGKEK